jgi:hypothetical protein
MWHPANKAASPSQGISYTPKKANGQVKDVLEDTLAALEVAQLRVLALTKDLDERKDWLAPIRKVLLSSFPRSLFSGARWSIWRPSRSLKCATFGEPLCLPHPEPGPSFTPMHRVTDFIWFYIYSHSSNEATRAYCIYGSQATMIMRVVRTLTTGYWWMESYHFFGH